MATTFSGSVKAINIKNKTYALDGETDPVHEPGYSIDVKGNGDGSVRKIKNLKPWSYTGIKVAIPNNAAWEHIDSVAKSDELVTFVIEKSNGTVEQGVGTISGTPKRNIKDGTAEFDIMGEQELIIL